MSESPLSTKSPNSGQFSRSSSPTKGSPSKRLASDEKENEPPPKARKSVPVLFRGEYRIPLANYPPSNAQLLSWFTRDIEAGKSQMQLCPIPGASSADPEEPVMMFTNPEGDTLMRNFDERIKKLEREISTSKNMYQWQMDIIQRAFEVEFKKIRRPDSNREALIAGNRSAHIPKLLETLETFNARDLHERFKERFYDSFACGKEMAEALQDVVDWVKVVDYAAQVSWTHFKLVEDGREEKFWHAVEKFNKDLNQKYSTAEAMKDAVSDADAWQTRLSRLLVEGEKVDQILHQRSLDCMSLELGEVKVTEK